VDGAFTWNRLSSSGEWFTRRIDPRQKSLRNAGANGWYVQGGYFIQPERSEAGLRYGVLDPDSRVQSDRTTEASVFFNRYLHGQNYKIQTELTEIRSDVTRRDTRVPAQLRDRRLRMQLVVSF